MADSGGWSTVPPTQKVQRSASASHKAPPAPPSRKSRRSKSFNTPKRSKTPTNRRSKTPKQRREPVHLLTTDDNVTRVSVDAFLSVRMNYVDVQENHCIFEKCLWTDDERISKIEALQKKFFDYTPLAVNDETRWKSKLMGNDDSASIDKVQAILNKLSFSNIDKLTIQLVQALGTTISQDLMTRTMKLILEKAILEPHFAPLYALLCHKLTQIHKAFKKSLLGLCQASFQNFSKTNLNMVVFFGELYMYKLIKTPIMMEIAQIMLQQPEDVTIEGFCKLMTIIGKRLDAETNTEQVWTRLAEMTPPDSRSKFLIANLVELRENRYENMRNFQPEKATTIAAIHGKTPKSKSLQRSQSSDNPMPKKQPLRRVHSEKVVNLLDPAESANKMEAILNEYFVNLEVADSVQSIDEVVQVGAPGSSARAEAVLNKGILLVLERKEQQVDLLLDLLDAWPNLPNKVLIPALVEPLEFLRDIELDAPKASLHLATMVARWLGDKSISVRELIGAFPQFFVESGRPEDFLKMVFLKFAYKDADLDVWQELLPLDGKTPLDFLQE